MTSRTLRHKGFDLARLRHALWWHSTYPLRAWAWQLNRRVRKTVTVRTRQGIFTIYCNDIWIGRDLFCYREWELDLAMRVKQVLTRLNKFAANGTLLDIGANIGVTSIGLLYNGFAQRAIAIEPEPNNFRLLQQNVRQNHFEASVLCLPCAVSDTCEEGALELAAYDLGGHRLRPPRAVPEAEKVHAARAEIRVAQARLDELLGDVPSEFTETISLVWIDVEGSEARAFLGGKELFTRDIPVVAEIYPSALRRAGTRRAEFCAILERFWSSYWVTRQGTFVRYPISEFGSLWDELAAIDGLANVLLCK